MSGLVALSTAIRLSSTSAMFLRATSCTKSPSLFTSAPAPPVPTETGSGVVSSDFEQPPMTMAASASHKSPL